jgi:ArsR family transcriptional regulator, virulence genes transcriptional regulator
MAGTGTARNKVSPQEIDRMVFDRQAQICKAFASPVRLQILDLLSKGECAAAELQQKLSVSKANLSQHMGVLKAAGVVATRKEGQHISYVLTFPEVKEACQLIRKVLSAQVEGAYKMLK